MELSKLRDEVLRIFCVPSVDRLGDALMECVETHDICTMSAFCGIVDNDLSKDWLQMVYQYYQADRKEKKQDYTPVCLARFLSRLIGESTETIDMCAGSGALTIQRWVENPDTVFMLYEIDDNVIPYLLFNCAVRNIAAMVYLGDVLQGEATKTWRIEKGERFGNVVNL